MAKLLSGIENKPKKCSDESAELENNLTHVANVDRVVLEFSNVKLLTAKGNEKDKVFVLEKIHLLKLPQLTSFDLVTKNSNFQPDFTCKINGMNKKLKHGTFKKYKMFKWTEHPADIFVRIMVKSDNLLYIKLLMGYKNNKPLNLKLIPRAFHLLRDRSGSSDPQHRCGPMSSLTMADYYMHLQYERFLVHKSMLTNSLYNVDDSVVIDIYLEPPFISQQINSCNGTLKWAIDNYRKRKLTEERDLVRYQESPYFYTNPQGFRVQVNVFLDGFRDNKGKGLTVQVIFLKGKFEDLLKKFKSFPHQTTITLINQKNPSYHVVKTVDKNVIDERDYFVDMCDDIMVESLIENDTLFYNVTIESHLDMQP